MSLWTTISQAISVHFGAPFEAKHPQAIGGGCINSTFRIADGDRVVFVKTNQASALPMFKAEAAALNEIRACQSIRTPEPYCYGTAEGQAYLAMEFIAFGQANASSAEKLGRQLAAMHHATAPQFGWKMDNTIGSTPQLNSWAGNWVDFFAEKRLRYQFELAARNGASFGGQEDILLESLPRFFENHHPLPALLHGDLWGGNWRVDHDGNPVLYDPASYYGDREADLAMTELFGGFPARFYQAYRDHYPLDPGYASRKTLYNLYHILNHYNLFGGSYRTQAAQMIGRLLSEI